MTIGTRQTKLYGRNENKGNISQSKLCLVCCCCGVNERVRNVFLSFYVNVLVDIGIYAIYYLHFPVVLLLSYFVRQFDIEWVLNNKFIRTSANSISLYCNLARKVVC